MRKLIIALLFVLPTLAHADSEELHCLADNIYFEARNQSFAGQIAVGQVTKNRVADTRYPDTYCEVVKQGPTRPSWKDPTKYYPVRNRCQFSWYCDGKADKIIDMTAYNIALKIAKGVMYKDIWDLTQGATHYHADYVSPSWASTKTKTTEIDDHIFYRWERNRPDLAKNRKKK